MATQKTVLSDRTREQVVETVLMIEFPDDPGAALGKHTMVRNTGPDWSRISAFDQRREELSSRERCPDDALIGILCDVRSGDAERSQAPTDSAAKDKPAAPATRKARRFRFER